uniref:Uncharacterized protein n=1 Tax=Knipowitschia caucasica TaxID=637954 RepID=A0AAV2LR60_KNICA
MLSITLHQGVSPLTFTGPDLDTDTSTDHMEPLFSLTEEGHICQRSREEEEDQSETQADDDEASLKECAQKQPGSCAPSFFYRAERERHHFVGQDIYIQEALDSFAAVTWPAAPALCGYLERQNKELDLVDKAVLEIGSGTGLVAIVAALLGAWVTATDLPHTLSNLRVNLSRNTRGKSRHTPQVAALPWDGNLERTYPTSVYHYDYVLASDVVYHHDFHKELLHTMKHFCQPGTTLLWANKIRMVQDSDFEKEFKNTFRAKLIFEDADMKIYMATCRQDGEEEKDSGEEDNVESIFERDKENNLETLEFVVVQGDAALTCDGVETENDCDEDSKSALELQKGNDTETCEGEAEGVISDTSEESEEEDDKNDDTGEEPTDRKNDTQGKNKNIESFCQTASILSRLGKDLYHYVGTDITIYESIDSYGAVMWPAALALCSFLENNRETVNLEDKTVLELGSGTGLVAIVTSLLGARVTATDLPEVMGNLRANVMRNTRGKTRHLPQIWPLCWGFDVGLIYPTSRYKFDYVVAADVVYHHDYHDELLATMVHFCHPRTTVIWANKIRMEMDITFMERFKKEFHTRLLAEDGDMKIFMGKCKM